MFSLRTENPKTQIVVATVLKKLLRLCPMLKTATIHTKAISDTMKAYSTMVAPSSSLRSFK
jgi:hypothetical protein